MSSESHAIHNMWVGSGPDFLDPFEQDRPTVANKEIGRLGLF